MAEPGDDREDDDDDGIDANEDTEGFDWRFKLDGEADLLLDPKTRDDLTS